MKIKLLLLISLLLLPIFYLFSPLDFFPLGETDMSPQETEKNDLSTMSYHEYLSQLLSLDVDWWTIKYLDKGSTDDPVVLLIHGAPTSSRMYRKTVQPLLDAWYRVVAPDLLWRWASEKPQWIEHYSVELQASRILSLMSYLKIEEWTHVMHDLWGLWSWELMTQVDDLQKINHLVVLNTIGFSEWFAPPALMEYVAGIWRPYTKLISLDPLSNTIMSATLKMMVDDSTLLTQEMIDGYLLPMLDGGWKSYGHFFQELWSVRNRLEWYKNFWKEEWSNLPAVSVIWGMKDINLVGEEQLPLFADYFEVQKELRLDDGVHLIAEEYADSVVAAITELEEELRWE